MEDLSQPKSGELRMNRLCSKFGALLEIYQNVYMILSSTSAHLVAQLIRSNPLSSVRVWSTPISISQLDLK